MTIKHYALAIAAVVTLSGCYGTSQEAEREENIGSVDQAYVICNSRAPQRNLTISRGVGDGGVHGGGGDGGPAVGEGIIINIANTGPCSVPATTLTMKLVPWPPQNIAPVPYDVPALPPGATFTKVYQTGQLTANVLHVWTADGYNGVSETDETDNQLSFTP